MTIRDRLKFDGRVALITGGAGGIGRVIAEQLRDLGAIVVVADRPAASDAAAEALGGVARNVHAVAMNVTDSRSVDDAIATIVRRHGRLDLLVAAAGISYEEDTLNHSDETWRRVMAINVDGVFYCMRGAGREMVRQGGGAIVAISSICGVTSVRPEVHLGYDVSKAAVAHMCRNLAVEWAGKNIRVNAVGPAHTDTEMLAEVGRSRPEVMKQWLDDIPMHRVMRPAEVADSVIFLLSDAASAITGHLLMVDGGYSVG